MNDLFATDKNPTGDYWNRYNENTEMLSDWFQEVSKGRMHVTGRAINIILDHPAWWYRANGGINTMNVEIYEKLKDPVLDINWLDYDLWSPPIGGEFVYEPDNYIDMIFKIHRTRNDSLLGWYSGIAHLSGDPFPISITTNDTIWIDGSWSEIGSGLTIQPRSIATKQAVFDIARHEYGHFLFGSDHNSVGVMGGGDLFFSPWEQLKLGYFEPIVVDYTNNNQYDLGDYSSRYSIGEILKINLDLTTEFFLIANRQQISRYDRIMYGDTARGNPFMDVGDYGKGVYIYHHMGGFYHPSQMDQECADGLFNWTQNGHGVPDWEDPTNTPWLPVLIKTGVSYANDNGYQGQAFNTIAYAKDGRSVIGKRTDYINEPKYFSIGKMHTQQGGEGFDRLFTNHQENWTSREFAGDRYDAWGPGYNEVFSPYSSPSTYKVSNQNSGLFIYFDEIHHNGIASVKVYRVGYPISLTEHHILELTPPSRPMGLKVDPEGPMINDYYRFKLTWNHNMEPDMRREDSGKDLVTKRYKIYRSTAANMNSVPPDAQFYPENHYTLIATVDIDEEEIPEYIDTELISDANSPPDGQCPPTCWTMYPVRYRVQAVDMYDDHSVLSDFAQGRAWRIETGGGGKDPGVEQMPHPGEGLAGETPTEFSLKQNYPNPFNPVTNIQFDLPRDEFVTIKIYDMTGREIEVLFNDFRNAGRYIVGFNASHLASGVYFYTIKAGIFQETRRMLLVK